MEAHVQLGTCVASFLLPRHLLRKQLVFVFGLRNLHDRYVGVFRSAPVLAPCGGRCRPSVLGSALARGVERAVTDGGVPGAAMPRTGLQAGLGQYAMSYRA